jgi:hypothetical protein
VTLALLPLLSASCHKSFRNRSPPLLSSPSSQRLRKDFYLFDRHKMGGGGKLVRTWITVAPFLVVPTPYRRRAWVLAFTCGA